MTPLTLEEIKNTLPFLNSNGKWVLPIYRNDNGELGGYNYKSEIEAVRAYKVLINCKERELHSNTISVKEEVDKLIAFVESITDDELDIGLAKHE